MTRVVDVELTLSPSEAMDGGDSLARLAAREAGVEHLPSRVISREITPAVRVRIRLAVDDDKEGRNSTDAD